MHILAVEFPAKGQVVVREEPHASLQPVEVMYAGLRDEPETH